MEKQVVIRAFNNKKIVFLKNTRLKRQTNKFDLEVLVSSNENISTFSSNKAYRTSPTTEHFIIIKNLKEITFSEDGSITVF